jgi:hypothetical protein
VKAPANVVQVQVPDRRVAPEEAVDLEEAAALEADNLAAVGLGEVGSELEEAGLVVDMDLE